MQSAFKLGQKKAKDRHSEPAAAGEESLLGYSFKPGGILRFAQNDIQAAFPAICITAEAEFGCGPAMLCVPYVGSKIDLRNRQ
jgi:hypothetical protein